MVIQSDSPYEFCFRNSLFLLITMLAVGAPSSAQEPADSIYVNGTIITLDAESQVAQGLAIRQGRILAVGSSDEVRQHADSRTVIHDLKNRVIIPGFYAAHDHFPGSGRVGLFTADLNSPPIGEIQTIDDLIASMKRQAQNVPKGRWVVGRGYDDTLLQEQRHPTRFDLDKISTEHPIWITHTSGHLGVANSLALERAKITRDSKSSAGGRIQLDPETGGPNGVIEESLGLVTQLIPALPEAKRVEATRRAVQQYVRQGVTTAVIASGSKSSVEHLILSINEGILTFRIVTMTSGGPAVDARKAIENFNSPLLKAGAIKLMQDGSIQGYTGALGTPYYRQRPGEDDYRGEVRRNREALAKHVSDLHQAGYQIAIHGNGDRAIDDILFAYTEAQKRLPRPDARHRIEHAQTSRDDQIDAMKLLGVTPSYFVGHVYYWGDRHRDIFLGPERGSRISPLAATVQRSVRFTLHDDTPVTPVNPLQLIWVAANRITSNGQVLGPEQRIRVEQALRAVTSDAAWQNFEEETKGTLEPGKLADLVILDRNPLTIDPREIRDIRVLQTIVGGQPVFIEEEE